MQRGAINTAKVADLNANQSTACQRCAWTGTSGFGPWQENHLPLDQVNERERAPKPLEWTQPLDLDLMAKQNQRLERIQPQLDLDLMAKQNQRLERIQPQSDLDRITNYGTALVEK